MGYTLRASIPLNERRVDGVVRDTGREYCDEHKMCVRRIDDLEVAQESMEKRVDTVERNVWKFGMAITGVNALIGIFIACLTAAKTFGLI